MRILRYEDPDGRKAYAVQTRDGWEAATGNPYTGLNTTDRPAEVARELCPIMPASIYCIGLNYREHARETGMPVPAHPVVFMKSPTAVQHPGGPIELPRHLRSDEVDYEAELAVVIGRPCKNASVENALSYVLGYTAANDVSARDWQIRHGGSQWCRAKTFDTFAPLGPHLLTPEDVPDPQNLRIRTRLNGVVVQDSTTGDMIFSVTELIAFLSGSTTLMPGTVILTGTPSGVGMGIKPPRWLKPGDEVEIEIDRIGRLTNRVVEERA